MRQSRERRLANRVVEDLDLVPPFDIFEVARIFGTVEIVDWPHKCDGIVLNLQSSMPSIFVRDTPNQPRQLFTVGHEIGHIVLSWHVDEIACMTDDTGFASGGRAAEREASTFASHLLVPDRYLAPYCDGNVDVSEVFRATRRTGVSAAAGLIAVSRALPPGYAFVLDGEALYLSDGTAKPFSRKDRTRLRSWLGSAEDSGRVQYGGRSIRWYAFEANGIPLDSWDARTVSELLRDAIRAVTDDVREQERLVRVINGVIGSATKEENRTTPVRAMKAMRHRINARLDLRHFLDQPDFEVYLHKKAEQLAG